MAAFATSHALCAARAPVHTGTMDPQLRVEELRKERWTASSARDIWQTAVMTRSRGLL